MWSITWCSRRWWSAIVSPPHPPQFSLRARRFVVQNNTWQKTNQRARAVRFWKVTRCLSKPWRTLSLYCHSSPPKHSDGLASLGRKYKHKHKENYVWTGTGACAYTCALMLASYVWQQTRRGALLFLFWLNALGPRTMQWQHVKPPLTNCH